MDHLTVQVGLGLPTKKAASVLLKPNKGEGSGQVGSNVNRAYGGGGTGQKGGWLVCWKKKVSNTSRGVEAKDQQTKHCQHHQEQQQQPKQQQQQQQQRQRQRQQQQQQQCQQQQKNIRPKQFILFCF